jgi:intein/homing endonuclease
LATTEPTEVKSTETTGTTETKTETKSFYSDKLKRAVHLLLFRRGKMPGAKDWELKEKLGKNYEQVLEQLNQLLSELDLEIKKVKETYTGEITPEGAPLEESRYQVILKGTLGLKEAKMIGWRIDNLAALSASLAYLVSKQGKAPREEIEKLLAHKFGRWKAATLVDVFLRTGYLEEDDAGVMALGWRTNSEVDLRALMTKMAEAKL